MTAVPDLAGATDGATVMAIGDVHPGTRPASLPVDVAVQGDALDREYIHTWAQELGVAELWRRALELAGEG